MTTLQLTQQDTVSWRTRVVRVCLGVLLVLAAFLLGPVPVFVVACVYGILFSAYEVILVALVLDGLYSVVQPDGWLLYTATILCVLGAARFVRDRLGV